MGLGDADLVPEGVTDSHIGSVWAFGWFFSDLNAPFGEVM